MAYVKRVEACMDLNEMISRILTEEEDVVAVNCPKTIGEAGIAFEKMQRNAGLIKDLTWDVSFEGMRPVVHRKEGIIPGNFNYVLLELQMRSEASAKGYVEGQGKKLIQTLKKYGLGSYQCLAYVKHDRLYLLFNTVDNEGKVFKGFSRVKAKLAFAGA